MSIICKQQRKAVLTTVIFLLLTAYSPKQNDLISLGKKKTFQKRCHICVFTTTVALIAIGLICPVARVQGRSKGDILKH